MLGRRTARSLVVAIVALTVGFAATSAHAFTSTIRVVASKHVFTLDGDTLSGSPGTVNNSVDPAAQDLPINGPRGVVELPGSDTFCFADSLNNLVRCVDRDGRSKIVAGWAGPVRNNPERRGYSGENLPARESKLNWPVALSPTAKGELLIVDAGNNLVRKLTNNGRLVTVAGVPGQDGGYNGDRDEAGRPRAATAALLNTPMGVAADGDGGFYISDSGNNRIRYVSPDGLISTFAGTGAAGSGRSDLDGDRRKATEVKLNSPGGISLRRRDNALAIADTGHNQIRVVGADGMMWVLAQVETVGSDIDWGGSRLEVDAGRGLERGKVAGAPADVTWATPGGSDLIFTSTNSHRVQWVNGYGNVYDLAGTGAQSPELWGDGGDALESVISFPSGVAVRSDGRVLAADLGANAIREIVRERPDPNLSRAIERAGDLQGDLCVAHSEARCIGTAAAKARLDAIPVRAAEAKVARLKRILDDALKGERQAKEALDYAHKQLIRAGRKWGRGSDEYIDAEEVYDRADDELRLSQESVRIFKHRVANAELQAAAERAPYDAGRALAARRAEAADAAGSPAAAGSVSAAAASASAAVGSAAAVSAGQEPPVAPRKRFSERTADEQALYSSARFDVDWAAFAASRRAEQELAQATASLHTRS